MLVEAGRSAVFKKCIKDRDKRLMVVLLIMVFLMILMVLSLFAIAIYLDLHPRVPIVVITNTTISSFNVQQGTSANQVIVEAFMDVTLLSKNRYGIPFNYLNGTLLLEYKGHRIATAVTPPCPQPPRSNVTFMAVLDRQSTVVEDGDVAQQLLNDFQLQRVFVSLSGTIKARFRASKVVSSSVVGIPLSCTLEIQPAILAAIPTCKEFIS